MSVVADSKGGCAAYVLTKRAFKCIAEKGRNLNKINLFNSLSDRDKYVIKDNSSFCNYPNGKHSFCWYYHHSTT